MAQDFFQPYALGGAAARPDSFSGMADPFSQALMAMLQAAPEDIKVGITSGYRSPEVQARLWEEALAKYGSEEEARKWVAPPGKSQHNHGNAADLKYLSDGAQDWVHDNAGNYGLAFPLGNEPWHVELASARGEPHGHDQTAAPSLGATTAPNALSGAPLAFQPSQQQGRAVPSWISRAAQGTPMMAPPEVTFEPLAMPTRRRA